MVAQELPTVKPCPSFSFSARGSERIPTVEKLRIPHSERSRLIYQTNLSDKHHGRDCRTYLKLLKTDWQ